jgi:hypothetical protein
MAAAARVEELERRLEADAAFKQSFATDPQRALTEAGLSDLAGELEQETTKVRALVDRLEMDGSFRSEVESNPRPALHAAGLADDAVEPFLRALQAPAAVLERLGTEVGGYMEHPPKPWPWFWRHYHSRPPWFPAPRRGNVFGT